MQTTEVREAAQYAVRQGKNLLDKQVDERTTWIGQQVGSVAQELRIVGEQLRSGGPLGLAAGYLDRAADQVDRLSTYLRDADSERLLGDMENVARKNPWGIAAGALVFGFATSRFLKTSSARRYRNASASRGAQAEIVYGETTYRDA